MDTQLSAIEVRVLGCLVEKESTTPDAYPLSLNAVTTACNQKTSRDPVMALDASTVQEALDALVKRTLAATRSSAGSRVVKYAHRLHDRLSPEFSFARDELAVMCLLFLRGPQTRGELRTHSARLHAFQDTTEVGEVLTRLQEREDGPYVTQLPVSPGHKEARFAHLVSGDVEYTPSELPAAPLSDEGARVAALEQEVRALRDEVTRVAERLDQFMKQFD